MDVDSVATADSVGSVEPVVKEVSVPLDPDQAFNLFTRRIASWWPLASHSIEGEDAVDCHFEPRVGGRLLEVARDGTEHVWGTLLAWEPPARIALTWHPGRERATEQHLEVTFTGRGDETMVRLVHTGWERLGTDGAAERRSYEAGWEPVLAAFVAQSLSLP